MQRFDLHQNIVGHDAHILTDFADHLYQRQAIEDAQRVVRNNHNAPFHGNVLFLATDNAIAEIEIFQHFVDELQSFEVVALREQHIQFAFAEEFLEKSQCGTREKVGLIQKCRVLFFQHLFDVDHAHLADLCLARGPLHDRERICQIRCQRAINKVVI